MGILLKDFVIYDESPIRNPSEEYPKFSRMIFPEISNLLFSSLFLIKREVFKAVTSISSASGVAIKSSCVPSFP